MTAVQMNTRIEESLKRQGDEVFARFGYSPSQVIRAVWEYAAENKQIPDFMIEAEQAKRDAEIQRKRKLAREGAGMVAQFAHEHGIDLTFSRTLDYKELRAQAYDEKLAEIEAHCG
ncbi:MAG: type II toxin-antitoxin system RelB/DinJ family antitoxin [Raoultibacter sp.]